MFDLTPSDVRNMAFRKPPLGKRGYDEEEVDAFLERVEQVIAALAEENGALRAELDRVRGSHGGIPPQPPPPPSAAAVGSLDAELAEIKTRLARIEAAVERGSRSPAGIDALFQPMG